MENSTKTTAVCTQRSSRAGASREGKITLVTIMAILGMVVLAGFVGNAGHVVTAKVNTQNAADAIAFSSAQWMARGMNAVTATNHLIGEVTGLVVAIESLGGPEADEGLEDYPLESKSVDKINQKLKDTAPMRGGYGASSFTSLDQKFINFVVDMVSPDSEEKAKHKAFATIYDAKMVLKRDLRKRLLWKTGGTAGFFVPPPFGYATAIAAYAIHLKSNYEMAIIVKEWIILEGLELLVTKVKPLKVGILENQLIPALAAHGDFIAGRQLKAGPIKTGVVNVGIADSLEHLGKAYGIKAAIFPGATSFTLPIETEPEATTNNGSKGNNEQPEWGSDEPPADSPDDMLDKLRDQVDEQKDQIKFRIFQIQGSIEGGVPPFFNGTTLKEMDNKLDVLLAGNPSAEERTKILDEKKKIQELREKKQKKILELVQKMKDLDAEVEKFEKLLKEASSVVTTPGNMSITDIPQQFMNQAEERYTQWVRATYPYVDGYRAPIMEKFANDWLEKSEAADFYKKWSNRYTLVKAWQFRSGFRFKKVSEKKGEWKKDPKFEPLKMYVVKDAFKKTGARKDQKGHEPWTLDSDAGKQEAEKLFTVIGMTHREIKPLFSPVIYPVASDNGMTTFAQAIFYNGNEQKAAPVGDKSKTQAKVGWDTLNWDPATATPEWGAEASKSNDGKWPWTIFKGDSDQLGLARTKLNWQAKLMPVTKSRLSEAAGASVVTSTEMTKNIGLSLLFFDKMVTH